MNLLHLPDCMLEQIFEFLSYDEIARKRLISKRLDKICQRLLNHGFAKMMRRHATDLKRIKAMLPRRESERRNHPLARHSDVLTCIETRISMLSMTYTKYMELNLCCFIPGKVIDEVLNILRLIETTNKPLRTHEVLQELRDISSMAIEHFDEKIAFLLKKSYLDINTQKYTVAGTLNTVMPPTNDEILSLHSHITVDTTANQSPENCDRYHARMRLTMLSMERKYKEAMKKLNYFIQIQNKQLRQMRSNAVRMSEMNSQLVDLRRRLEESDAKNREMSANISQIALDSGSDGAKNNSSNKSRNIKPRTATIILKRRITEPIMGSNIEIATKKTKKNSE